MIRGIENILIGSEDATKLAKFYREVVGLKQTQEFEMGDDQNGFMFEFDSGIYLTVMDHSEVKGKAKDPQRLFFNLEVDDIEEEFSRLKKAKVEVIAGIYYIQDYGLIATFADPDGNYFQLVQVREKSN